MLDRERDIAGIDGGQQGDFDSTNDTDTKDELAISQHRKSLISAYGRLLSTYTSPRPMVC